MLVTKNRKLFFIIFAVLLILGIFWVVLRPAKKVGERETAVISAQTAPQEKTPTKTIVTIGTEHFTVEIAKTDDEQARGLANRDSVESDHGMLFPFSEPAKPAFWMKEMRFAIDIIWIRDNKVVDISRDLPVPPANTRPENLPTYQPKEVVNYVLEIKAGTAKKIKIGDSVQITQDRSI